MIPGNRTNEIEECNRRVRALRLIYIQRGILVAKIDSPHGKAKAPFPSCIV